MPLEFSEDPLTEEPTDEATVEPTVPPTESAAPEASPSEGTPLPIESATPGVDPTAVPTAAASSAPTTAAPKPTAAAATPTPAPKPTAAPTPTPEPTPVPTEPPKPDIPPFSSKAINTGQTYDNSIFASCRLTMVNVWATTCGPCIQEMPEIQELADNYAGRGLKVLSVLADSETPGKIQEALGYINEMGFKVPVIRYNKSTAAAFPAGSYPYTYFIDSNGNILKIVQTSNSYAGWASIVDGLL